MNQLLLFTSLRCFAWMNTAVLLISLFTASSAAATDPVTRIDSLQRVLRNTVEDTARADLYLDIGSTYWNTQRDSAFHYFRKAMAVSQRVFYYDGIMRSKDGLARWYILHGDYSQGIAYVEELLSVAQQAKDRAFEQRAYRLLGGASSQQGHYTLGLQHYQKALSIAEQTQDTLAWSMINYDIGIVYAETGDYDHAISIFNQIIRIGSYQNKSYPIIFNNLAAMYEEAGNNDSALFFYQRALYEAHNNMNKRESAKALNGIAMTYVKTRQYAAALPYVKQALALYKEITPHKPYYPIEDTMGQIYAGLQRYQLARLHYNKAMSVLKVQGYSTDQAIVLTNLIQLDSLEGNFSQAFTHQQQLIALKDSLANINKAKVLEELKVQYETEQKDQEITLLQAQTDRQQLEARQQSLVRNSFMAGSVALLLLLGLGYSRYRFKHRALGVMQRQNEEIQVQKEQVERKHHENQLLLKEVHHRVKNNLQIVLSILNAQADSLHDPATVAAIRESQHRVHSMALIHQSLYQSDDLSQIQAQHYLRETVQTVYQAYHPNGAAARLRLQIEDLPLDMSTAVPVGLIVTELVTNACKHGLSNPESELTVALCAETATQYRLTVADNGPGLPPNFDVNQSDSLGLQLVQGLTQQLDGELTVQNGGGTRFELLFRTAA